MRGRDREIEKDRETERQRERETERQRETERERDRERQRDRETETDRQTNRDARRKSLFDLPVAFPEVKLMVANCTLAKCSEEHVNHIK